MPPKRLRVVAKPRSRLITHLKLELGYHWTYLRRRGIPDLNQHALMLNIPISTR